MMATAAGTLTIGLVAEPSRRATAQPLSIKELGWLPVFAAVAELYPPVQHVAAGRACWLVQLETKRSIPKIGDFWPSLTEMRR